MVWIPPYLTVYSLLSVIFFIIFLHKWLSRTVSTPQQRQPPSPAKLPFIGNLHQLGVSPHRSLHTLSKHYGELMLLHLGRRPVIIASSPDAAREIMKNQDSIFSNRPKLGIPDKLTYGSKDVAFSPYGKYWRQARGISTVHLLSTKRVRSFRHVREEETSLMVERITSRLGSSSSLLVVNFSDVFVSLTNDVVCRVALGRKYSDGREGKVFKNLLDEFVELLGTTSVGDYVPWLAWIERVNGLISRVKKTAMMFDEFLEGVVEEHRRKRKQEDDVGMVLDFVDILLELQRENKDNFLVADDELKALIMDMFAAGTDTTSSVLTWTMAELIKNPKTMKALQSEVRRKNVITEDDLERMYYLKAVIKESLRLHSPAPLLVPRESTQHTNVLGYDIPKGTQVMINAWAIARDPLLWKNPETFSPERFLDSEIDFKGLHFELIPFGSGRRGCPGMTFAEKVIELALAKIVHKFDFALPDGETEDNMDMSEANGITVHKRLPLNLVTYLYSF